MSHQEHYLKKELYQRMQDDPELLDFLFDRVMDGCWYWDLENPEHEWMSPGFWGLLGYAPEEKQHLASEWQDLIHPDDLELAMDNFRKHCQDSSHPYDQLVRYQHKDGSTVYVRCRGIAIRDQDGNPLRLLGTHMDITPLVEAEESLHKQALQIRELKELTVRDDLTGLYNRRGFQDKVEWLLQSSKRQGNTFSVLVVDVDDFKTINDEHGHDQGDKVLIAISSAIISICREVDVAARYGGDEFVVGLPQSDSANSCQVAERIRTAILTLTGLEVPASVTIGIATYDPESTETDGFDAFLELMIKADRAMYFAKNAGKNQICHSLAIES